MATGVLTSAMDALDEFPGYIQEGRIVWFHQEPDIRTNISRMAREVRQAIRTDEIWILGIKNGGLPFANDLSAELATIDPTLGVHLDFIKAERYGEKTIGEAVKIIEWPAADLAGKVICLADDIMDEGITLADIKRAAEARYPGATILVAAYILRVGNQIDEAPKLVCRPVLFRYKEFLAGYGLNWVDLITGQTVGRTERRIGFVIGT